MKHQLQLVLVLCFFLLNSCKENRTSKNSKLETIVGYFPNLDEVSMKKISNLKYSFVHLDFDLYQPTIDCFKFIENSFTIKTSTNKISICFF